MSLQQLRDSLKKGFYVKNLYGMIPICRGLAVNSRKPSPFFLIEQIFLNIARQWEERDLPVEEAGKVQSKMIQPLNELLDVIDKNVSDQEILDHMNKVTSIYLNTFK